MAGGRPRKDQTESRAELCKLTRDFVATMRLHSPHYNMAELERQLGMSTHGEVDGSGGNPSHGKKLERWQKAGQKGGQCPSALTLQYWVVEARKRGLLPPTKGPGGLRRFDQYFVGEDLVKREDLDEIVKERLAQAKDLEKARAAAVAALTAYASAIKGAGDWWVVADFIDHGEETIPDMEDMPGGVIRASQPVDASPEEILGMAKDLERHLWIFAPKHS